MTVDIEKMSYELAEANRLIDASDEDAMFWRCECMQARKLAEDMRDLCLLRATWPDEDHWKLPWEEK